MAAKAFYMMLLAHLLYDFHWQGQFIAENKGRRPFLLAVHALTDSMLQCLGLYLVTGGIDFLAVGFLFVTHYAIDNWKSRLPKTDAYFWAIYVDQGMHLLAIVVVSARGFVERWGIEVGILAAVASQMYQFIRSWLRDRAERKRWAKLANQQMSLMEGKQK